MSLPPQDSISDAMLETLQDNEFDANKPIDGADEERNWRILSAVIAKSLTVFQTSEQEEVRHSCSVYTCRRLIDLSLSLIAGGGYGSGCCAGIVV